MPPMKNIHNAISDAFTRMRGEGVETDYIIDVTSTSTTYNTHQVRIRSKNPNATGRAELNLMLDLTNNILDYDDTNDLFINSNWDAFCLYFENQLHQGPLDTLQGYLQHFMNENIQVEEDTVEP